MRRSTSLAGRCTEREIGKAREVIVVSTGLSQMAVFLEQNMICDGALVTGPVPGVIVDVKGALIGPRGSFMALLR